MTDDLGPHTPVALDPKPPDRQVESGKVLNSLVLGIDIGGTGAKLAVLRGQGIVWTTKRSYRTPTIAELVGAIRGALHGRDGPFAAVGLCVPGILDESRQRVALSVNVPALMEIPLADLVRQALGSLPPVLRVVNDSVASGYDIFATRRVSGRLLVLAMGTGVGAAVLDDGVPLRVDGESPGHIGQMDVSVGRDPLIGPDGGAGSLEGYIGAPALRQRYGPDPASKMRPDHVPMLALAKAIRICHAIYRPHHVVLAGGLGIRLERSLRDLRSLVQTNLTRIARPDWTLTAGDSDFHAACGAARLAMLPE